MITMKTSKLKLTTMTWTMLLIVNVKRPSKASRNFAKPVSRKDITEAMQKAVPLKTQRDNKYYANLWEEWVLHRAKRTGVTIPYLNTIKVEELQ